MLTVIAFVAYIFIYIYIYMCPCFVPSNFAAVRSYVPSMLLQRNNSEFRGAISKNPLSPVRS